MWAKWLLCVAACLVWQRACEGHGRLAEPPGRSSLFRFGFNNPPNYDDHSLDCGGWHVQYEKNNGKCGVCGDPYNGPRDNEAGGRYANGIIARHYKEGATIDIVLDITAQHGGWHEFRICPNNDVSKPVTQECLDKHVLYLDGKGKRWLVPRTAALGQYSLRARLPDGLVCQQCVLQWKWQTANNPGFGERQEQHYACADVSISPRATESQTPSKSRKRVTPEQTPKIFSSKMIDTKDQSITTFRDQLEKASKSSPKKQSRGQPAGPFRDQGKARPMVHLGARSRGQPKRRSRNQAEPPKKLRERGARWRERGRGAHWREWAESKIRAINSGTEGIALPPSRDVYLPTPPKPTAQTGKVAPPSYSPEARSLMVSLAVQAKPETSKLARPQGTTRRDALTKQRTPKTWRPVRARLPPPAATLRPRPSPTARTRMPAPQPTKYPFHLINQAHSELNKIRRNMRNLLPGIKNVRSGNRAPFWQRQRGGADRRKGRRSRTGQKYGGRSQPQNQMGAKSEAPKEQRERKPDQRRDTRGKQTTKESRKPIASNRKTPVDKGTGVTKTSKRQQPTGQVISDAATSQTMNCKVSRRYRGLPHMLEWCHKNCALDYCPSTHCVCT